MAQEAARMYTSGQEKEQSHSSVADGLLATIQQGDHPNVAALLDGEQGQQATGNTLQHNASRDTCVQQLVERQAVIRPDAVALVAGNQTLSYQELNQRANQLAHYLRALGVGPDVLVGLCVERSLELVIGLLGILKAGGAYVPLDPAYPAERLAFMVEDARVPVLITRQDLARRLQPTPARLICLEEDPALAEQRTENPPFPATPDHLAYIIYTSGSTGQPKGVQITHQSLANLVAWHLEAFAVTSADRATQISSPAFDATGWELWPYLCGGASVSLVEEPLRTQPEALRDWLVQQRITLTFVPTALAERLLTLDWPPDPALRLLLTGADMLQQSPRPDLPFALVNNYGPTEATVVATSGLVPPVEPAEPPPALERPPIGRPIAHTEVVILDEQGQPVPPGSPGELHLGGVGLARGYLHRPDLTAATFIPHPFSPQPGARLYKTGDLVRLLPDGQLAFLGRVDHQIALRGYRIEPGEIVAALQRHPAIQASYVLARAEAAAGEQQLVAYLVARPGLPLTRSAVQQFLQTRLPDYMVPARFVLLEALPLTPNGKVDRAALPAPTARNTLQEAEADSAPATPTEAQIAEVVAALLHVERVGRDENFFLLGGHSMLGAQLVTRLAETFGVELPLRALFAAPTVRQLAAEVEQRLVAWIGTLSDEDAQRLLR